MSLNADLLDFLQSSPSPFHAVASMVARLEGAGYQSLDETTQWSLQAGGRYYVTRNGSSIVAFHLGSDPAEQSGFRMVGAHTDSPCLKVKPNPDIGKKGYQQLGVEIYGGALLNPWFDRDLSLAGRVTCRNQNGDIKTHLVNFERPVAVIPSLAIHLDKEANKNRTVNPQEHMPPILCLEDPSAGESAASFNDYLIQQLNAQGIGDIEAVLDYEIVCYDTQPPALIGLKEDFIASARLDNLLSCKIGLDSLLAAGETAGKATTVLVCNDHEEVGSGSAAGAQGPFLRDVLERIAGNAESVKPALARSMMISVDNAHGVHPNYANKHDESHGPILNQGPVIKINAKQRYASNSETSAVYRDICEKAGIPFQAFVVRSDMACGSTIGPITAAELGVPTLDIGVPTFAMHSVRELGGSQDPDFLLRSLVDFYGLESLPWVSKS